MECGITSNGLVLAKGLKQISEWLHRNVELADGFRESNKDRVSRTSGVASMQFPFPFVEQLQRGCGMVDFVAQIIRDSAVGINTAEVLAQALRKEPGCDRKIFVMCASEVAAVFLSFGLRRGANGDGVAQGQKDPRGGAGFGRGAWGHRLVDRHVRDM